MAVMQASPRLTRDDKELERSVVSKQSERMRLPL
jgi:hypothetical protein